MATRRHPDSRPGATCIRPVERVLCEARGLRADYGDAPADAVAVRGLTGRSRPFAIDPRRRQPGSPGSSHGSSRDACRRPHRANDILDNITLYWLTTTGVSAARLYWENKAGFFEAKPISIPYAISVFPDELYQAPRSWAERAYPGNLIHFNELDQGGHFAAWEQPQLFAEEVRAGFRSLR